MVTKETLTKYCDLVDYITETEVRIKRIKSDIERINKRLNAIENGEKVSDKVYGGEGGWQGFIIEGIPVPEHEQCKTALLTKRLRLKDEHAVLAEQGNDLHDLGHDISAQIVELVDKQGDALVHAAEDGVDPFGCTRNDRNVKHGKAPLVLYDKLFYHMIRPKVHKKLKKTYARPQNIASAPGNTAVYS